MVPQITRFIRHGAHDHMASSGTAKLIMNSSTAECHTLRKRSLLHREHAAKVREFQVLAWPNSFPASASAELHRLGLSPDDSSRAGAMVCIHMDFESGFKKLAVRWITHGVCSWYVKSHEVAPEFWVASRHGQIWPSDLLRGCLSIRR